MAVRVRVAVRGGREGRIGGRTWTPWSWKNAPPGNTRPTWRQKGVRVSAEARSSSQPVGCGGRAHLEEGFLDGAVPAVGPEHQRPVLAPPRLGHLRRRGAALRVSPFVRGPTVASVPAEARRASERRATPVNVRRPGRRTAGRDRNATGLTKKNRTWRSQRSTDAVRRSCLVTGGRPTRRAFFTRPPPGPGAYGGAASTQSRSLPVSSRAAGS